MIIPHPEELTSGPEALRSWAWGALYLDASCPRCGPTEEVANDARGLWDGIWLLALLPLSGPERLTDFGAGF